MNSASLQNAARKTYNPLSVPGWRNWQTRRTQNPVPAREWGFDSLPRHHSKKNAQAPDLRFLLCRIVLGDEIVHDIAEHVGEAHVAPAKAEGELRMVKAK